MPSADFDDSIVVVRAGAILVLTCIASSAYANAVEAPICADRPGKANPTCTVPAGMVQVETGLVDWTRDSPGDERSQSWAIGSMAIKYGLSKRWHIELDVSPVEFARARVGGTYNSLSSFGDLMIASKYRLTGGNGVQLAINPHVKLPTAKRSIGNGRWEGGIAFPIDYGISNTQLSLALGPELDWLADEDVRGHHLAMVQVVGLGWQVTQKFNVSGELWGQWDWERQGTTRNASADAAAAYLVNSHWQLDAGANFGLTRLTPDIELYAGVAVRF